MKTSEKIDLISKSLVKAQGEMGSVIKDSKNPFFKSSYATLNAVREAVIPPLTANGITVLQPMVTQDGKSYVETVLLHESGQFLSGQTEVVIAKANDPQAYGSGVSYSRRYSLMSMLSLGQEDDDGEAAMGRKAAYNKPAAASTSTMGSITVPSSSGVTLTNDAPKAEAPKRSSFKKPAAAPAAPVAEAKAEDTGWE